MCGLVGVYQASRRNNSYLSHQVISDMLKAIEHRGPDARQVEIHQDIGFGFNRLSIIDLLYGMQPMYSHDRGLMMICNGEIFNYLELKKEFEREGYVFKTRSDVEVILPLYAKYKHDFLNKLNGQFALAIYDFKKEELLIARDHFGICPLYYTHFNGEFLFASEIKALLKYPGIKPCLSLLGLDQLMTFPGTISPQTMFKNIYSVEPGTFYTISKKKPLKSTQYWDYNFVAPPIEQDPIYYIEEIESRLSRAVKLRMRADVPVGAYLSGGLDSTLVLSFMKKLLHVKQPIRTFSIDFFDDTLSEKKYFNLAADFYKTQQYEYKMDPNDIIARLPQIVYHSESLLKETFNTASFLLSDMAKQQGVKVILSGQGSDELFAGYVGYLFDAQLAVRQRNLTDEEKIIQFKLWGDEQFVYERIHKKHEAIKLKVYSEELAKNFQAFNCINHHVIDSSKLLGKTPLVRRSYIDLKLRLADHLLSGHGDHMAMANSVETRYPFLDKHVVELAMQMPDDLKLHYSRVKHVIRECAKNHVPEAIINREKQGFAAGGSSYLLQSGSEYINELLSYQTIKKQGIFNPNYVEELKINYSKPGFKIKPPFDNDLLMPVITLGIWMDAFGVSGVM